MTTVTGTHPHILASPASKIAESSNADVYRTIRFAAQIHGGMDLLGISIRNSLHQRAHSELFSKLKEFANPQRPTVDARRCR